MELILVILLIMVVVVLLNKPKKQRRLYTSTKTEPTSVTRETPSVIPGVILGEKNESSPQMALKTETGKQIESVLKFDNDSVQVNTS